MYRIVPVREKHRVVLDYDGVFDYDPRALQRDLKRCAAQVRCPEGTFDFLADFSMVRAIPEQNLKTGEHIVRWCRENGLRRCANVMVSATQRMAVERRTNNDPRFDFFLTREEAELWLERPARIVTGA